MPKTTNRYVRYRTQQFRIGKPSPLGTRNPLANPLSAVLSSFPKTRITERLHDYKGSIYAAEVRQIHGRLARLERQASPRRVPHRSRSPRASGHHESSCFKPQATPGTIARASADFQQAHRNNPNTLAALKIVAATLGTKATADLTPNDVAAVLAAWQSKAQHTRWNYTKALARFLRHIKAPEEITSEVPKVRQPSPRLVIATDAEREGLLAAATPRLRFFLLLCADLGLRHRTATRIALSNYDSATRSLSFTTKGNAHQTLPATREIADTIEALIRDGADTDKPIVTLLRPPKQPGHPPGPNPRFAKAFDKLKTQLRIRRELHIHDLRRTAAEDVWEATKDLRLVQAQLGHRSPITTVRYLANRINLKELAPVRDAVDQMRARRMQGTP